METLMLPFSARYILLTLALVGTVLGLLVVAVFPASVLAWSVVVFFGAFALLGLRDLLQTKHSILRNYPIAAHLRFILEGIRPEMRQYFFEGEKDGAPYPRDKRAIVYQRAKHALDKRPFGTHYDVYQNGYEWLNHSMAPRAPAKEGFRIQVGGPHCKLPYSTSVLNISAMSFGSLSPNAIRALNRGAKLGNFAHDTGEGSVSKYHREFGGDLIWEIGSGYFGCRTADGDFDPGRFEQVASDPQIKMIELKLSQGAKPGQGGILPAAKITREISETRGIPMGKDCISPAAHSAFSTPIEMIQFIERLRTMSGGKPTGFKLCVGHPWQFMAVCKAMLETGITPDFIVVDGKEGGTGAAPLEFMDHMGMPLRDGLTFVHNALVGIDLRGRIRLAGSGKIISAFDMACVMALGADWCNVARGFMFAVGCIQAQTCHTGECPTGVTATSWSRQRAIVVTDKAERVHNFHRETVKALAEFVASAGLEHPGQLRPHHFLRRAAADRVVSLAEHFQHLKPGDLLENNGQNAPTRYSEPWRVARADTFRRGEEIAPDFNWTGKQNQAAE